MGAAKASGDLANQSGFPDLPRAEHSNDWEAGEEFAKFGGESALDHVAGIAS